MNPGLAIPVIDLRGRTLTRAEYKLAIPRAKLDVAHAVIAIEPVLEAVRTGNEETLKDFAEKFDGVRPAQIRVPASAIDDALANLDPDIRTALEISIGRVRLVHEEQARKTQVTEVVPGATVSQKWIPVDRVGLYVPGGKAV